METQEHKDVQDAEKKEVVKMLSNKPGVITLKNWIIAPSGVRHLYFWGPKWLVIECGASKQECFIAATSKDSANPVFIIPVSQLNGWSGCDAPPTTNPDVQIYAVE